MPSRTDKQEEPSPGERMSLFAVWLDKFRTGFVAVEAVSAHGALKLATKKTELYCASNTQWDPLVVFAIPYEAAKLAVDYAGNPFPIPPIDVALGLTKTA